MRYPYKYPRMERVWWLTDPPVNFRDGSLYFRLTLPFGRQWWAVVHRAKSKQYWMDAILNHTLAVEVEEYRG